jgi:hypothetical protein
MTGEETKDAGRLAGDAEIAAGHGTDEKIDAVQWVRGVACSPLADLQLHVRQQVRQLGGRNSLRRHGHADNLGILAQPFCRHLYQYGNSAHIPGRILYRTDFLEIWKSALPGRRGHNAGERAFVSRFHAYPPAVKSMRFCEINAFS